MKKILGLVVAIVTAASVVGGAAYPSARAWTAAVAYVDPALYASNAETLQVIVTAGEASTAALAVDHAGGRVTSRLRLIDAVAATVPRGRLDALAAYPGVRAIVDDKGVRAADHLTCADGSGASETCLEPDGYITERQVKIAEYALGGEQTAPAVNLPDGGLLSVTQNGQVLILNADGSVRARRALSGDGYRTAPVVSPEGTVYLAGGSKRLYALSLDGSLRWEFVGPETFTSGAARGLDGTIYAATDRQTLYALDPATGRPRWTFAARRGGGKFVSPPAVGPDGTVYLLSDRGQLLAIHRDGYARWAYVAARGAPYSRPPLVGADGTVVIAGDDRTVYAINPDGSLKYRFAAADKVTAQPLLAADGSLYVPAAGHALYALNADGAQRFAFDPGAGHLTTSPLLSADGAVLYIAAEQGWLYAVEAATGVLLWQYSIQGKVSASPILDALGHVVLGSDAQELAVLNPDGTLVFSANVGGRVRQSPTVTAAGDMAVRLEGDRLALLRRLPNSWDGRPDVMATDDPRVWKFVNPYLIDVGADVARASRLPDGRPITGEGVTVAIVDSGVYFDPHVKKVLGKEVAKLFRGQADFVGDGACRQGGTQFEGYCWYEHNQSRDRYGHGTHVAGIIWSNFYDYGTGLRMGIAPDANILSVRVLGDDGVSTYRDVIEGIQFAVEHKDAFNVRVMNLSLSAEATVPYFADPLNRAVEEAWRAGIVVLAAAGNTGPSAETVTVPGSDPYVITVGAVNGNRTPGYWADDFIPQWSATGPTLDGFVKPEVLAPGSQIVSFMYNDPRSGLEGEETAYLARQHPDYSPTTSLFRMNGTSMSTAIASGVAALMLQAHPGLTPDQVKFRLMYTARPAVDQSSEIIYNVFQQGAGRIWAPEAVLGSLPPDGVANVGMDIDADLAHGYDSEADLAYHYQGPVRRVLSDDGLSYLYYVDDGDGTITALGAAWADGLGWIDREALANSGMTWGGGRMIWSGGRMIWSGGRMIWSGGQSYATGRMVWSGGRMVWSGGRMVWSGGRMVWSGGRMVWSGATSWAGGPDTGASGRLIWSGQSTTSREISAPTWVEDW